MNLAFLPKETELSFDEWAKVSWQYFYAFPESHTFV
jgi:hypothetical protein